MKAAHWFATKPLKLTRKDSTVRRKRWIRAFVLTLTAALPVGPALISPAASRAADDSTNRLVNIITDNNAAAEDRATAALQLVNDDSPAAVASCLQQSGNPGAQAAVAKALSQVSNPDPIFIPLLAGLLGSSRPLTAAAAPALANYRGNRDAFNKLTAFIDVQQNPNSVRIDAIHAIGSLADRSAAKYLIDLLSAPNQNPAIQKAAMEALAELTSLNSLGTDIRQWQQWWAGVSAKNPDQFQAMLLEIRIGEFNRAKQRDHDLYEQAGRLLGEYYYTAPDEKKTAIVLKYLNNTSPDIREIGVNFFNTNNLLKVDEPVRKRLFAMIDDPDDTVRSDVVTYLATLNDRAALKPLIDRLGVEQNLQIKIHIAQALANLKDPDAAPALLKLLHDPQIETKTAAARAFYSNPLSSSLGEKLRQADPKQADDASRQIRDVLDANAKQSGTDDLRAACLLALAALRDKQSFDTFIQYAQPGETNEVRGAALQGLGNLSNPYADQIVANQLRENNDRTVRLQAARAMQSVATPGQADQIFNRMNNDPDKEVSDALWVAFQNLYPKESPEDLEHWQAQFDNDPKKKLVTLIKLGDALKLRGDKEQIALNQQRLADAYMAVTPRQPQDAIDNLQAALDYWRGPGKGDDVHLQTLVEQLMDAQLQAGRYVDAVAFAAKQIALNPAYQGGLEVQIADKADKLSSENKLAESQALITEALNMKPPLEGRYVEKLQSIQAEMKQKTNP